MDGEEYNDMVRFLESKDDKHRTWPRRVKESKDKEAKRAYRKDFATHEGLLFKTNRRKKHETGALPSMRAEDQSRYRVIKMDEKMRLLESVHKDPAGGHFGVHIKRKHRMRAFDLIIY